MSAFGDQLLLRFLQDAFVEDLLTKQLGLEALLKLTYEMADIDLKEISLGEVSLRRFQLPAFETIRTSGIDERIMPSSERVKVDRAQPRYGRLAWVDVFMDVLVATKVESTRRPLESITAQNLLDKLGGVASIADLRAKLATLYAQSIVEAFFKQLRINSVDDFKSRPAVFLEFIYKAPPPFDPSELQNARMFRVNVCVQLQPELKVVEALQAAKLCRSILENEKDFADAFDGGEIITPYVFVVIFPDSAVTDNAIPGLNAAQIRSGIQTLFTAEKMIAHFST
jgi:hypothetical protein